MDQGRELLRVAIVDRDTAFVRVISARLEAAGWSYRLLTAPPPLEEIAAMKLGAVVIDTATLGEAGWDYLERLCGAIPDLGVIVTADRSTVAQRVRGLRIGADDWIQKPCHAEEAMARIEAVARRRRHRVQTDAGPVVHGEIEIRPDQFQAFAAGESLDLTRREFELLQALAESQGRVLEREGIYQRVWGYAMPRGDRSVDVFVRKLRHKIERRSPGLTYIHTHFGVGYRFEPEPLVPVEGQPPGDDRAPAGPLTQPSVQAVRGPAGARSA